MAITTAPIEAQEKSFYFNTLTVNDGLAGTNNYFIYKDSKGFCWISSVEGLNRFDGQKVRVYSHVEGDSTSLLSHNLQSDIIETENSNLWFSTVSAVIEYDRANDQFNNYKYPSKQFDEQYTFGYLGHHDTNDEFWLLLDEKKVVTFNKNRPNQYQEKFDLEEKHQRMKPLFDANNKLMGFLFFSFKYAGFCIYDLNGYKQDCFLDENSSNPAHFRNVIVDDSIAWCATLSGIFKVNFISKTQKFAAATKDKEVQDIEEFDDEHFLVASKNSGLLLLNKNTFKTKPASIGSAPISTFPFWLYKDRDDNFWVSVDEEGIYYASLGNLKFNNITKELAGGIRGISEDQQKNIWLATKANGIYTFSNDLEKIAYDDCSNNGKLKKFTSYLFGTFYDRDGRIWALNSRGVFVKTPTAKDFKWIDAGFIPHYGLELSNGLILISSVEGGLYQFNYSENLEFQKVNSVSETEDLVSFYQNKKGQLLACNTFVNLDVFEVEKEGLKKEKSIPFKGWIYDYCEVSDSIIWMATDNGLAKLNQNNWTYKIFNQNNGFPFRIVKAIEGTADKLWLATNDGLVQFLPETEEFFVFNTKDGLYSTSFYECGLTRSNGEIWFGNTKGATYFHPDSIQLSKTHATIQLTGVLVNDEKIKNLKCEKTAVTNISEIEELVFDKKDNTLSFEFAAIDFADPENTQLRYRLNGYDKDWVNHSRGESGFARYGNLPAGEYTFEILGANNDGIWTTTPKQISIEILPHFMETSWFQGLLLMAFLGLVYLLYHFRLSQVKEKEQLRTRAAENKLEALQSQMNPHFIFNSLNSINSYILGQNARQASVYIGRFAKLMRMILEYSQLSTISLEKEIELLRLYTGVEKLRFKTPFEFEIDMADDVDDFETEVPPMMLQPFVENAIWHGIANKQNGVGKIIIKILKTENYLKCVIEDNGIGRVASAAIKNQKGRSHKSKALDITKERLRILQAKNKNKAEITFEDLMDKKGNAAGTRAILLIPLF